MLTTHQATRKYGTPNVTGEGYLTTIVCPYPLRIAWDIDSTTSKVRCHKLIAGKLLAVSVTITGFAMYQNVQWVALIALITGVIGKFLTNFFIEDDTKTRKQRGSRKNPTRIS